MTFWVMHSTFEFTEVKYCTNMKTPVEKKFVSSSKGSTEKYYGPINPTLGKCPKEIKPDLLIGICTATLIIALLKPKGRNNSIVHREMNRWRKHGL